MNTTKISYEKFWPCSVEVPVGNTFRIFAQRLHPKAAGVQIFYFVANVISLQSELAELMQDIHPVS